MVEKKASNSGAGSLPILLCHGKGIYKFIIARAYGVIIFLTDLCCACAEYDKTSAAFVVHMAYILTSNYSFSR